MGINNIKHFSDIGAMKSKIFSCPYCGGGAVCNREKGVGFVWSCPNCKDVKVNCRRGTKQPYGTLANKELRGLRVKGHDLFDKLNGTKHGKYTFIKEVLNLETSSFGMLNKEEIEKVIAMLEKKLKEKEEKEIQNLKTKFITLFPLAHGETKDEKWNWINTQINNPKGSLNPVSLRLAVKLLLKESKID